LRVIGIGNQRRIPKQEKNKYSYRICIWNLPNILKKVWHKAICNEFRSSWAVVAVNAAIIPVIVVPILDPNVNGYIRSIDIIPRPTSGVKVDVNIELLCTSIVNIQPT
jgi:hypothetical protein